MRVWHPNQRFHGEPVLDRYRQRTRLAQDAARVGKHFDLQPARITACMESGPLEHAIQRDELKGPGPKRKRESGGACKSVSATPILARAKCGVRHSAGDRVDPDNSAIVLAQSQCKRPESAADIQRG